MKELYGDERTLSVQLKCEQQSGMKVVVMNKVTGYWRMMSPSGKIYYLELNPKVDYLCITDCFKF